jgi:predicted ribosome-associated RNA-binding protein Tma20
MEMKNKEMKFIRTDNEETAHKLRYEQYTEITEPGSKYFCFLNDGKKLNFDAEKYDCVYTNLLCL